MSNTSGDDPSYNENLRMKSWIISHGLIPVLCGMVLWPIAYFSKVPNHFERSFAGAELIIVSYILFMATAAEFYCEGRINNHLRVSKLDWLFFSQIIFSIVFFTFYTIAKTSEIQQMHDNAECFAIGSIAAGIFSLVWCIYSKYELMFQLLQHSQSGGNQV